MSVLREDFKTDAAYEAAVRKDFVKGFEDIYLLPRCRTKGMKDFLKKSGVRSGLGYLEDIHAVFGCHTLKPGGYLEFGGGFLPGWLEEHDVGYEAIMESYDKFLCYDGMIRYIPSEESDKKYKELYEKYNEDFWRRINAAFESQGMFYDDEKGYWVNPETGETGCY